MLELPHGAWLEAEQMELIGDEDGGKAAGRTLGPDLRGRDTGEEAKAGVIEGSFSQATVPCFVPSTE